MSKQKRNRGACRRAGATIVTEVTPGPVDVPAVPAAAEDDPLDFALRVMRDEGQPMALRASMAKAAMSAMKGLRADDSGDAGAEPGDAPDPYPCPSSLELARRIALILDRANDELRGRELAAEGWDVRVRGLPVDNTDWPRIIGRLAVILDACPSLPEDLDSAGIRF